jgi:hypothetical protein
MRTRVFLNPSDPVLVGKYSGDHEHVHVICDSSDAPFTIQLPDLFQPEHKEFIFYNMPENGTGNTVTIVTVSGQVMRINETSHALAALDTVGVVSDLKKRWLLSDVNH